jgi:hypothetical protein
LEKRSQSAFLASAWGILGFAGVMWVC